MRFSIFINIILYLLVVNATNSWAQKTIHPSIDPAEILPEWAALMYAENPNVWAVETAYCDYYKTHSFVKTTHTQYYKKWRRANRFFITPEGYIQGPSPAEERARADKYAAMKSRQATYGLRSGTWTCLGPYETFADYLTGGVQLAKSEQANVYCFEQSPANPNVLYCGTEGGEIFRSTDKGLNWACTSRLLAIGAPTAMKAHPTDANTLYVGEYQRIYKSTDGGMTWDIVLTETNLDPTDIAISPANPNIIMVSSFKGLYRSTNGGTNWTQLYAQATYDLEFKPDDANIVYLLKNNPTEDRCEFFKSTDGGANFTLITNGWYNSTDPNRDDAGARMTVSSADPNRIYAILIGQAKSGDNGFIGIWRSNDAGNSWTLPNSPPGGPYNTTTHPNLATFTPDDAGGYHQGFYNLGIAASDTDADDLLVGCLNLWRSTDGAASVEWVGGYGGFQTNYVHPDIQEIEINGQDMWFASDGGINYTNNLVDTHQALNNGITSGDYWGFGTGWNEDVLVGGRYHNGNGGYVEGYPEGKHLGLGGGEAPTGYVNPGRNRDAFFSDIGGKRLPTAFNGTPISIPMGKYPNESYYAAESSEMEFDPRYYQTIYIGNENKLWKTTDGGNNFDLLYTFGTNIDARLTHIEISRSNPNVIYAVQRDADTWAEAQLWKTSNGGATWASLTLPTGYARRMVIALSATDANTIWIGYPDGANGEKVFKSTNGGSSWGNLTTNALDNENITYIMHHYGSNGGIYVGTDRKIFYRNNTLLDWELFDDGLPATINTNILRPFYRDGKIRMASYGKGIWESPLYETAAPVAQPMVDKATADCYNNNFFFDDYSALSHDGATWAWQFPGGIPATSNLRNPQVNYPNAGSYDVTLTVTNAAGSSTKTIADMITILPQITNPVPIAENIETSIGNLDLQNPDADITWASVSINTCPANGNQALWLNCYAYSSGGQTDNIALPINLDLTNSTAPVLTFDLAYSPYYDGNVWTDSLRVLISDDCGSTFQTLYYSGGEAMSTNTNGNNGGLYQYESFAPDNCNEWRKICLPLADYAGNVCTVLIQGINGYGNNMYVDNIELDNKPLLLPNIVGDNAVCTAQTETYTAPAGGTTYTWTVSNGTILSGQGTNSITVSWSSGAIGAVGVSIVP